MPTVWDDDVLIDDFTPEYGVNVGAQVNWAALPWALAVDYPARQEVWLWLPLGARTWCDVCYVLDYSRMGEIGPVWRGPYRIAATAACVVDELIVDGQGPAMFLLIAGPDGFFYTYPCNWGAGADGDMGPAEPLTMAQCYFAATRTVPPPTNEELTLTEALLPVEDDGVYYGIIGNYLTARDLATGKVYTGLVRGNTEDTIDCVWLAEQDPPAGTYDVILGGLAVTLETAWLRPGGDESSIVRQLVLSSGGDGGTLALTLRAARAPTRAAEEGVRERARDVRVGRGAPQARIQADMRGVAHQVRLQTSGRRQRWQLHEIVFLVEPGGRQ